MFQLMMFLLTTVLLIGNLTYAHGQKQAERYIPIGQSPGLSGKVTFIGIIETVDSRNKVIKVKDADESHRIRITNKTRIWLDRSKLKMTNLGADPGQLRKGQRVEVKYLDHQRKQAAEWIKIEVTTADGRR